MSVFVSLLRAEFGDEIGDKFPDRLSLVSTAIPADFSNMLDMEFAAIRSMLAPGSRRRLDAKAKIRAFAVLERSLSGSELHHSDEEMENLAKQVSSGADWRKIFPGVKTVRIDPNGSDTGMVLKIAKAGNDDKDAVSLVPVGTPGAAVVGVKTVNDLGYYSLYFKDLVQKIQKKFSQLNRTDIQHMIRDLNMKSDVEMFKSYSMASQKHQRYSAKGAGCTY